MSATSLRRGMRGFGRKGGKIRAIARLGTESMVAAVGDMHAERRLSRSGQDHRAIVQAPRPNRQRSARATRHFPRRS